MKDEIGDFIKDEFGIDEKITFEFREVCGFTFVFKKSILKFRDELSSAEIKPVGIIYEENGEFCFAHLHETSDLEAIIKEFVEKKMK